MNRVFYIILICSFYVSCTKQVDNFSSTTTNPNSAQDGLSYGYNGHNIQMNFTQVYCHANAITSNKTSYNIKGFDGINTIEFEIFTDSSLENKTYILGARSGLVSLYFVSIYLGSSTDSSFSFTVTSHSNSVLSGYFNGVIGNTSSGSEFGVDGLFQNVMIISQYQQTNPDPYGI